MLLSPIVGLAVVRDPWTHLDMHVVATCYSLGGFVDFRYSWWLRVGRRHSGLEVLNSCTADINLLH